VAGALDGQSGLDCGNWDDESRLEADQPLRHGDPPRARAGR
jgi:hypothetical protein